MGGNPVENPIEIFLQRLKAAKIAVDYRDVRDALWLSRFLPASAIEVADEPSPAPKVQSPDSHLDSKEESKDEKRSYAKRTVSQTQIEETPLYVSTRSEKDKSSVAASTVRAPGVATLPKSLEIAGSLRPFLKKFASRLSFVFDEEATIHRIAEGSSLVPSSTKPLFMEPIFSPKKERWFDVVLVVEDTPSVAVWKETIAALAKLLSTHGAFSDVRRWGMRMAGDKLEIIGPSGEKRSAKELKHPTARRLILIVSDCVSKGWSNGAVWDVVLELGSTTPVTLLQVLPDRLWAHTGLGRATVRVRSILPGLPNSQLKIEKEWWDTDPVGHKIALPIITLEPSSIKEWAAMLMEGRSKSPAVLMTDDAERDDLPTELTPESRIQSFRSIVSPDAFQLAAYCTAVPLTLPVMRLVQRTMLPNSTQAHLAEILLGGIIKPVSPQESRAREDQIIFDFHEGVRDALSRSMRDSELMKVLIAVSKFVERHMGQTLDFEALTANPEGIYGLSKEAIPFAKVGAGFFGRLSSLGLRSDEITVEPLPYLQESVEEEVFASGLTIRKTYVSPEPVKELAYSPDGSMLALLHDRGVTILSTETGEVIHTFIPRFALASLPSSPLPSILLSYKYQAGEFVPTVTGLLSDEIKKRIGRTIPIFSSEKPERREALIPRFSNASLMIVLITPDYFRDQYSVESLNEFINFKRALGIEPNIIPIQLGDTEQSLITVKEVAEGIMKNHWTGWRGLGLLPVESAVVKQAVAKLADSVVWRLFEDNQSETTPSHLNASPIFRRCVAMTWSSDSSTLAIALNNDSNGLTTIAELDTKTWKANSHDLFNMPGQVKQLRWRPDRPQIAMVLSGGSVCLWYPERPSEWRLHPDLQSHLPNLEESQVIEWSSDGENLASLYPSGSLRVIREGLHSPWADLSKDVVPAALRHIAFIPNTDFIAFARSSSGLTVWDYAQRSTVRTIETDGLSVRSLSSSNDGNLIAAVLETGALKIWQTKTAEAVNLGVSTDEARSLSLLDFSPSRQELAVLDDKLVHFLRIDKDVFEQHVQLNDFAIVIGIDFYPALVNVPDAKPNAATFLEWVCSPGGGSVSTGRCEVRLTPSYSSPPEEAEPTNEQIVKTFGKLVTLWNARKDDGPLGRRLFIYMSGLGIRTLDRDLALLTADASNDWLGRNVSGRMYADWFLESGAFEEVILFMDCYMYIDTLTPAPAMPIPFVSIRQTSKETRYLYVFSTVGLEDRNLIESDQSFNHTLLRGLRGEATDRAGNITAHSLIKFIRSTYSERKTRGQLPVFESNNSDLVIASVTPGRGKVEIEFDPFYYELEIQITDANSKAVATTLAGASTWNVELLPGLYQIYIPAIGLRRPFDFIKNQVTRSSIEWQFKDQWVLVAGTGKKELSYAEDRMCEALGKTLAEAGYGLITGGWEGVDHVVGRAFTDRFKSAGRLTNPYYIQIVPNSQKPDFAGETIITVDDEEAEYTEAVRRAFAVVLIGGLGGTYQVYLRGKKAALPVIPIPGTEGDARVIYNELLEVSTSAEERDRLRSLDVPIRSSEDVQSVTETIISILIKIEPPDYSEISSLPYDEAIDLLQRRYDFLLKTGDMREQVRTLNSFGEVYQRIGRFDDALLALRHSREISEELGDRRNIAVTLNNMAGIYHQVGRFADALATYDTVTNEYPENLDAKIGRAEVLKSLGRFDESLAAYDAIIVEYPESFVTNTGRAQVLMALGRFDEAVAAFQHITEIDVPKSNKREQAMALNGLGEVYQRMGRYDEAVDAFQRSHQISVEFGDERNVAIVLNNLGEVYRRMGRYDEALAILYQGLDIAEHLNDKVTIRMTLNRIGVVLQRLDRFKEALDAFQRSYQIAEELDDRRSIAVTLNNIGGVYQQMGKLSEAVNVFQRSVQIGETLGDRQHLAMAYNNLGGVYQRTGRLNDAVHTLRQSYNISLESGNQRGVAIVLNRLGEVLRRQGKFDEAFDAFQHSIAVGERLRDMRHLAIVHTAFGRALLAHGNVEKAILELIKGFEINESLRNRKGISFTTPVLIETLLTQNRRDEAIGFCRRALSILPNDKRLNALYNRILEDTET